ncbi:MAG: M16 family metallopeptidase [Lachnospirales bacterium]
MYEIRTLSNGIKVVLENTPIFRSVSVGVFVKNGSRYEKINENGISHFIEHLLFKGTKNRNAKEIADAIDSVGGYINAGTTKEMTYYFTKTLDTHFSTSVDILSDMYFNSLFEESAIEKEANVILEEINMHEDYPDDLSYEILTSKVFSDSSLGMAISGKKEIISKFRRNDFINFFNRRYSTQNTVISIVGNIDFNKAIDLLEKQFGVFINNDFKDINLSATYNKSIVLKEKDIEQNHINIAFEGTAKNTLEYYDLAIFSTLLGNGMSSILNQKIREEKGLCYAIFSENTAYSDIGLFSIYTAVSESNTIQTIELIENELSSLKRNLIDKDLLDKTKERLKSSYILSLESPSGRMLSMGSYLCQYGKIKTADEILNNINCVTLDRLEATINKVLDFTNMSISAVGKVNSNINKYIKEYK